jgi:large subunit ribosomal protein L15
LFRRLPKHGFTAWNAKPLTPVRLDYLLSWIDQGRIDPSEPITMKVIRESGLARFKHGVKLVGGMSTKKMESLPYTLNLEVSHASESVTEQIEKAGGSVKAVWFNRVTLRAHLFPDKFAILPKSTGLPPPKKHHRYVPHLKETGLLPQDWEQEKWDHSRHIKQK